MLTVKFERLLGSVVRAGLVGQEISMDGSLNDNWTVLNQLPLDVLILVREANVVDSVDLVVDPASIGLEMVSLTFSGLSSVLVALLSHIALSHAEVEHFVGIATITPVVGCVTIDDLLCREADGGV